MSDDQIFRILALDGGGAKGFYTLGVLKEIEALTGGSVYRTFPLMYGTSTGSIIAALLALGHTTEEVHKLYRDHIPCIMRCRTRFNKTAALKAAAIAVFGDSDFSAFKTDVGIVATQWGFEKPMIFKTNIRQAHGRTASFVPGFGCKIKDAVQASCSALPFFERCKLTIGEGQTVELADGGYCANNPSLYALADAVNALKYDPARLRVVSLGVGTYPEPKYGLYKRWVLKWPSVRLLQKTLNINTSSMDTLRQVPFRGVPTVRINETFSTPEGVAVRLGTAFGEDASPGDKAFHIEPNESRRSADVVACFQYRRYIHFIDVSDQEFIPGIIIPGTSTGDVINYPKAHSANLTGKHQSTSGWLKPTIRMFKNIRNRLVESGVITKDTAPSYFIEGMLYNVPDSKFGKTYADTFCNCFNCLWETDRSKLVCANRQYWLLGDTNVQWSPQKCSQFLEVLLQFWNNS